jgi:2-keto-4-pentenoate hydratase/2-oxohepta-3-ene-1,7-dioic acid hydratase in catechol pathway
VRLARLRTADGVRLALGVGDDVVCLEGVQADPVAFLAHPERDAVLARAREHGARLPVDEVAFAPSVAPPGKVLCLALNYRAHAAEGGFVPPDRPVVFLKGPNAIAAHGDDVVVPVLSRRIDHEGELAVVVGRRVRDLSGDWRDVVAGYTIMNDLTARDLQLADIERGHPWDLAKSFDGYGPVGPWLVTPDEIANPHALDVTVAVDGEVRQHASTGDMIFGVGELIRFLSSVMTLEPGDVIATGTPEGIGPVGHGAEVAVAITGLGELRNRIRFARP